MNAWAALAIWLLVNALVAVRMTPANRWSRTLVKLCKTIPSPLHPRHQVRRSGDGAPFVALSMTEGAPAGAGRTERTSP